MPNAQNTPGFTSFSDYLNANQGSLDQERQQSLAAGQSAVDKAQADYNSGIEAAGQEGNAAGVATYKTTNGQVNGPGQNNGMPSAPAFDPSAASGYGTFQTDLATAQDAVSAGPNLGGKSTWESSLIQGSPSFRQGEAAQQGQLKGLSDYLDKASSAYTSGFGAGYSTPPPPEAPTGGEENLPGVTNAGPNTAGPTQKPARAPRPPAPSKYPYMPTDKQPNWTF